jgi:hypothetical protein
MSVWLVLAVVRPVADGTARNDYSDMPGAFNFNPSFHLNNVLNSCYDDSNDDIYTDLFDSKYYDRLATLLLKRLVTHMVCYFLVSISVA